MTVDAYTIVSIYGYAACLWYGKNYISLGYQWTVTFRVYRRFPVIDAIKSLWVFIISLNSKWTLSILATGLIMFLAIFLLNWKMPLSFVVSFIIFAVYLHLYQSTPPSILVLGSSNMDTSHLRMLFEKRFYPARVVSLLEPSSVHKAYKTMIYRNIANWDNLRTRSRHWQYVVLMLMRMSPIIVIDATVYSDAVEEEIQIVFSWNLFDKTLFLVGESDWSGISTNPKAIHKETVGLVADENAIISHVQGMGNLRRWPVDF